MAMNCRDVFPLLSPQLDGELPAPLAHAVEVHLRTCAGCQSRQAQLISARDAVRRWPEESVSLAFGAQLTARLAGQRTEASRVVRRPLSLGRLGVAAAALAAVLLLVTIPWRRDLTPPIAPPELTAVGDEKLGIDCGLARAGRCHIDLLCASAIPCGLPRAMPGLMATN